MALGGQRYSGRDVFRLTLGMFALYAAGWWLLNQPFDPANRILPHVYFSASWRWQPDAGDALRPRPEVWGGLLFALIGAWAWAAWARGDRFARNLALWGMVGGLGFPIGQCLQSWHAWNRELFTTGIWATLDPVMNWWNWMETTFGAVMGASFGLGVWLNRKAIGDLAESGIGTGRGSHDLTKRGSRGVILDVEWPPSIEWALVSVHVSPLIVGEFTTIAWANALYDPGLVIAFIPLIAVAAGRWWPFLVALPITLVTDRWQNRSDPRLRCSSDWATCRLAPLCGSAGIADDRRLTLVRAQRQSSIASAGVCANGAPHQYLDLFLVELCLCPLSLAMGGVDSAHAERHRLLRLRNRAHRCQPGGPLNAAGSARCKT
jgi:hypothetical protein